MNSLNCYGYKESTGGLVSLKTQFKDEQGVVDKKQNKKINELGKIIKGESYQNNDGPAHSASHPNISTQPSILPQKFGDLDIKEVLIPLNSSATSTDLNTSTEPYYYSYYLPDAIPSNAVIINCSVFNNEVMTSAICSKIGTDNWSIKIVGDFIPSVDYTTLNALIQYYLSTNNGNQGGNQNENPSGDVEDVDEIGTVDRSLSSLNITIDDNTLSSGTYTMVYEDSTGTPLADTGNITQFTINQ